MVASVCHFGYSRSSGLAPGRVYFDDVTVFQTASFSPSTLENSVSKSIVFKLLNSEERFRMAPFSVIVFGVVLWTIAVSSVWTGPEGGKKNVGVAVYWEE